MVKKADYWLFAFIGIHVFLWTLAPTFVRYTLPMDAMEGSTWGHQFEWGYDKNPFMNGWLTALAIKLGGQSGWMTYLFSQLSVALCFWAIWQLGKKILPPLHALIAVFLLEGIQYYNFHAIDFNDNTLELGFWALTILFFYQATREKNFFNWIMTGLFAGISMMTKYYVVVLLLPMLLYMIVDKDARKSFQQLPMYAGLCVFLLVIAPHVIWLFSHNFVTVNYAVERVSSPPDWWVHLFYPAQFSWQMFDTFMPAGILFFILLLARSKDPSIPQEKMPEINLSDKTFLLLMGLGPYLITILLSAIAGFKLRSGWGQPLMSLWGGMLVVYLKPTFSAKQFYRFSSVLGLLLVLTITGYCTALIRADKPSSANYPGTVIAATLTKTWHEKYNRPMNFIAGTRWLTGNVALYSPDHPSVYIDWNKNISTWIDENKLKENGAIFVWELSEDNNVPYSEIKKRFPNVSAQQPMEFSWLRNKKMAPVKIMIAYLPPEKTTPII